MTPRTEEQMSAPIPDDRACLNTDRELWREREGDYYSPSIFVTQAGSIGIDVGGFVIVRPIRVWHDHEQLLRSLPADWRKDSSLETWFPLTAEDIKRDKERVATLEQQVKLLTNPAAVHINILRGTLPLTKAQAIHIAGLPADIEEQVSELQEIVERFRKGDVCALLKDRAARADAAKHKPEGVTKCQL